MSRHEWQRGSRLGRFAAALIAAAALVTAGPIAHADTKAPTPTPPPSAPALSAEAPDASTQASTTVSNGSWSCTLSATLPTRWYGGSGGGEQAFGNLNCTHVMPEIYIAVGLYRDGMLVADTYSHRLSASFANAFPSTSPHVSAIYESGALGAVLWPDNTITHIPQVYSAAIQL